MYTSWKNTRVKFYNKSNIKNYKTNLISNCNNYAVPNVCNSKQNSGCFADPNGNIDCTQNVTEVVCKCPAGYIDIGSSTNVSGIFCQGKYLKSFFNLN